MKQLYILDGSGYVFRAFYGLPALTNSDGQQVHAIYGFFRMLFKLWQRKPNYFCIAWDSPTQTIRKDTFEDYKANRIQQPDEFKRQMRMIKELVKELNIPFLEMPGYEADDIIASLICTQRPEFGYTIVSSDKDLKQLVREDVVQYDAMKEKTTTVELFWDEYKFAPEHMIDYLSLVGDSADNIKWVPGIGPKSAADLVQKYQTIENIYAHIDEITGAVKEKLVQWKESALQSKHLIGLWQVPGMEGYKIDELHFEVDAKHFEEVLINQRKFASLQPFINELKKNQYSGQQASLF